MAENKAINADENITDVEAEIKEFVNLYQILKLKLENQNLNIQHLL